MRTHASFTRSLAVSAVAVFALVLGLRAEKPGEFIPDGTFTGSTLAGWRAVGDVDWKAENGEIIATPGAGGAGGWLIMEQGFEDVQLYTEYRCTGQCKAGLMLRSARTPDGGMGGVYVSFTNGEIGSYNLTLDAQNQEVARERIVPPGRRGGGGGGGGGRGGAAPPEPTLAVGEWHEINILITGANLRVSSGGNTTLAEEQYNGFGPIALYAGGSGEVRFKDFAWKDLNAIVEPKEETSSRYTAQQISGFYYGWGASASDINRDGNLDIVMGPFYYLGPDYTTRKIYRQGQVYNPSTEYAPDMVNLTADFTGDGWPDILSTVSRRMVLYVNPAGESRRWDSHSVLPTISSEIVLMKDLDNDGKPELVFGQNAQNGGYAWTTAPADPTQPWPRHSVWGEGQPINGHGIGVGDVNSDGRPDVVVPTGWYEQPAAGITVSPWTFHAVEFGNNAVFGNGGGEMGVYDVNGDGLTDVVGTQAHNWGINWYEQKKAADGTVSWVTHRIAHDFSTENMGGVVFEGSHAARFADMNGDGITDMITGKRYWGHLENYNGPDPYGPGVVYIYRTVRDANAPGGARFEPELVHNRSGVGSSFEVMDLNNDNVPDIATAGAYGAHVFLSK
jgi:hypothetical protein